MAIQNVTFTEWTPDQPSIVENLSSAKNVVPAAVGYIPFPLAVDYSDAASEDLNSVFAGKFSTTTNIFAGGDTKLFRLDGSDLSLDDVSKSIARPISNVELTSNVATITTSSSHGYSTGDSVTVDASNNNFDGSYTITSIPTSTTFTYNNAYSTAKSITNVQLILNVATITSAAHGYSVSDYITVDCSNNVFDGSYIITAVTTDTFSYDKAYSTEKSISNVALTSNVATITSAAHGYSVGNYVTVDCSNNVFDGSYIITAVTTDTFSYAKTNANITSVAASGTIYQGIESASASGAAYKGIESASATGTVIANAYNAIDNWNFIQFGSSIIAANNKNKLQVFTLGSSTSFGDLSTVAPVAKYVTVVRDFVVAANLDSGTNSATIAWSDINDETNWTAGGASQSDSQIIPDGGNIRGVTGGEFGLVLLDRAIVRMTYIGSPFFFQFDTIARGVGCVEGNSVAKYGNITYFLGEEGFYACDGQTVTAIGNEKVDRWFWSNVNPSKLNLMSTTVDPFRKIVIWHFLDNFANKTLIIYNWQVSKWTYGITDVDYVASSASAGATLEGMDLFGNMDTIETSFDSPLFSGGKFLFSGTRGNKIITFTGQASAAQIDTGLIGSQYPSVVTLARPLVDSGSADVAIASQVRLEQVVDFGTYTSADSENRVSLRSAGKYHKLSIKPTGANWQNIIGVDLEVQPQGTR